MNYQFKAASVRTIKSPSQPDVTTYFVYVNFKDLPDGMPLDVNPRKPKMTTAVAKQLIEAVKSPDTDFDINNRGIVIVAKKLTFDSSTSTIKLDLDGDTSMYGILDGGHTYTAIIENRDLDADIDKFVKLEVIIGDDLTVSRIADARNTSASVSDIALFELDDKFDFVKNAIVNETYANQIAYKDNDITKDNDKRLQVIDLLKLLFAFNVYDFPDDTKAPIQAYSGKASVFKNVKVDIDAGTEHYESLAKVLPDLVNLYDQIELDLSQKYQLYKNKSGDNARFGGSRGVKTVENGKSHYLENPMRYDISIGFILPIFGAFRVLLKETKSKELTWSFDPIEVWEEMGEKLVQNTFETTRNPQEAGKNSTLWLNNYRLVKGVMQEKQIADLMNSSNV